MKPHQTNAARDDQRGQVKAVTLLKHGAGRLYGWVGVFIELVIIVLWVMFVTRPYLNLDPTVTPDSREFLSTIQSHHIWLQARECGLCALWYGHVEGGFPSFVDPISSVLHPLVIVTTLSWGVLNGAKVALVASFVMAGLAQWWLARALGLGFTARLWSACLAVAAGHLAARMDLGAFNMVLSTAACALVIPPLLAVMQTGSLRMAVALGIMLALACISGNGYLQIGLAFSLLATPLLLPWERAGALLRIQRLALALLIALLLAAPFLVPYIHFMPSMAKDFDLEFKSAQSFLYVSLNLIIRDEQFYLSESLGKMPFPAHHVLYIGVIPVLLAIWGVCRADLGRRLRPTIFLATAAFLALWVGSAMPLRWIISLSPFRAFDEFLGGARYTAIMAGMAIPYLLALAALGLDRLVGAAQLRLRRAVRLLPRWSPTFVFDLRWLLLPLLLVSLFDVWSFNRRWISASPQSPHVAAVISALQTPDLQWVSVPLGQHFYVEPAVGAGLKLATDFFRTWHWRNRERPQAIKEAHVDGASPGFVPLSKVDGIFINIGETQQPYAVVRYPDGRGTICDAQGTGGQIDVVCETSQPGLLIVREQNFTGWQATINQTPQPFYNSQRLQLELPAGTHTIQFRYRPWDVGLGFLLCILGIVLSGYAWWRGAQAKTPALLVENPLIFAHPRE